MTALATGRNTPEAIGDIEEYPVLAGALCYEGGIAVLDSNGYCKPGVTGAGLIAAGCFQARADNSAGASGDIRAKVKKGVFRFANSAGADEVLISHVGDNCYIADDQTVAIVATGRSIAGRVEQVDAQGVWVRMGSALLAAPGGALLAANNLSDIGTPATARINLGVDAGMGAPAFVIGAEAGDIINVSIQLKDIAGADLAVRGALLAYLSDDANGDSVAATAPDTVAIGTDGVAVPLVAGKVFLLTSEADGDIDINITEDGADTWYLILVMPNGRLAASGAITFA
jgi:hypothetical protein